MEVEMKANKERNYKVFTIVSFLVGCVMLVSGIVFIVRDMPHMFFFAIGTGLFFFGFYANPDIIEKIITGKTKLKRNDKSRKLFSAASLAFIVSLIITIFHINL